MENLISQVMQLQPSPTQRASLEGLYMVNQNFSTINWEIDNVIGVCVQTCMCATASVYACVYTCVCVFCVCVCVCVYVCVCTCVGMHVGNHQIELVCQPRVPSSTLSYAWA